MEQDLSEVAFQQASGCVKDMSYEDLRTLNRLINIEIVHRNLVQDHPGMVFVKDDLDLEEKDERRGRKAGSKNKPKEEYVDDPNIEEVE